MTTTATMRPPAADDAPEDSRTVKAGTQTLDRGLDLLELAVQEPATVIQLAERSGLSRAIAYRLVGSLAAAASCSACAIWCRTRPISSPSPGRSWNGWRRKAA